MEIINPHRFATSAQAIAFDGFGNASRSFDGSDDYVAITDNADIPLNEMTCAFWLKLDRQTANASGQGVISQWGASPQRSFAVFIFNSGPVASPAFFISGDGVNARSVNANQTLDTDTWYHIACTFDPSNSIKIYIDGVLANTVTNSLPSSLRDSSLDLRVGRRDDVFDDQLGGNVSDFRLYDTDIGATAIADLYNGTNITTNLVGHWLKDTPSLLDHAGSNDATNYGSSWSPDNPSPAVEFGDASRSFDGVGDYVTAPDGAWLPTGEQTWACWVKYNSSGTYAIFNHNGSSPNRSIQIVVTTAGKIQFQVSADGTNREDMSSSSYTSVGEWYHVACVFNPSASTGQGRRIYINGTLDKNDSTNYTSLNDTNQDVGMGANGAGLFNLDGKLADCRIYDADIGSTEIANLAAGTDYQTNLIGHWLTNNDDVNDYAGTNDGTNNGSTYSLDNPSDKVEYGGASRVFNGTSDYIDLGDSDNFSFGDGINDSPFSLSAWLELDNNDKFRILHKSAVVSGSAVNELFFGTLGSGKCCLLLSSGNGFWYGINTTSALVENEWLHISATYDGTGGANLRDGMNIYVNGVAVSHQAYVDVGSPPTYTAISNTIYPLWIGKYQNNNTFADGNIADFRIYDDELTSAEVYELYKGVDHRTNLIGQWLTNSDDVEDKAGTNDGTNFGSTYSINAPL